MFQKLLFFALAILLPPLAAAAPVTPATLIASYWLDQSAGLDISGLSFCGGELLAVSDKDSSGYYTLRLGAGRAALEPRPLLAGLDTPPMDSEGLKARLIAMVQAAPAADFEGITCDEAGIFLVSERHHRIAAVNPPHKALWMSQRWSDAARERGYMRQFNAASEGLVKTGEDFWIALERERRGLVRFTSGTAEPQFFEVPAAAGLDFRGRSPDLTGLAYFGGDLFTLERNAFAVCRRSIEDLQAKWCIEYRAIEEAPEFVYQETRYGKGEGLAVDASGIYVVLDNNNVGRAADPADRRALLLHLAFPATDVAR
ncbi:esterase-like activity of phytase family protein [Microbulbifer magnicolonia]|uniref:esterase-like activity of phytase family protein n=1 Tax=Microbulbifer magnicolonia TaxID=3109744 RepID=UPI002B415111|nr:esterase-like activity of phytase family protein [Microbulbifer sp. GG15]